MTKEHKDDKKAKRRLWEEHTMPSSLLMLSEYKDQRDVNNYINPFAGLLTLNGLHSVISQNLILFRLITYF
jgi:hypothetical protein